MLFRCIRGEKKKIIIIGDAGVGKSSLKIFIRNLAEKHTFLNVLEPHKIEYANHEDVFAGHFLNYLMHICFKSIDKKAKREEQDQKGGHLDYLHHMMKFEGELLEKSLKESILLLPKETLEHICPEFSKLSDKEKKVKLDSPTERRRLFVGICKSMIDRLPKNERIILVLDDFHQLTENVPVFALVNDLIDSVKITGVILMQTERFKAENIESVISKDAFVLEVGGLPYDELPKMMRVRMLFDRNKKIDPERPIDWITDIKPFEKVALDTAAKATQGNPLHFIRLCGRAYNMISKNKTITKEIMDEAIVQYNKKDSTPHLLPPMTQKESEIYSIIRAKEDGLTAEDVAEIMYGNKKKRVNAVLHLLKMFDKKIIKKERRGRNVFFLAES